MTTQLFHDWPNSPHDNNEVFLTSSIPIQLTYCMLFTSSVIRVSKHLESITTGSRKSPTSRLRFQFRPRLQAATLGDRSVRRCMKSNTLKDSRICASCDKLGEFFNQLIKENGTVKSSSNNEL